MTIKDYLSDIRMLSVSIQRNVDKLEFLKGRAQSIGGMDYSKDRVQTSPSGGAPYTSMVQEAYDLQHEITKDIDRRAVLWRRIDGPLREMLTVKQYEVIDNHYYYGMSHVQIAGEMNCTLSEIRTLHRDAVDKIEKMDVSMGPQLTKMMRQFIDETNKDSQ